MRVTVSLMRHRGVPLDRDAVRRATGSPGDLRVEEVRDETLGRTTRFARLAGNLPQDRERLPPLLDAQLAWMGSDAFVLLGLERQDGADFAQGWLCRPL